MFFTALTPLLPHYTHVAHLSKSGAGILVASYPVGTGPAFASAAVAGGLLMVLAFAVPAPREAIPQGLREAFTAIGDRRLSVGLWLTMLAGLALGVLDTLAPLRMASLGVTALVIAG